MLTPKQKKLFDYICRYSHEHGVAPSYENMRIALALKSKSPIAALVNALINKGYCKRVANKARGLEIVKKQGPLNAIQKSSVEMLLSSSDNLRVAEAIARSQKIKIPLYGQIAAGLPLEAFNNPDEHLDLTPDLLEPGSNAEEYFALTVYGNSMIEAGIRDGDTVVIKLSNVAENNAIAAVLIDEQDVTLKKVIWAEDKVILVPQNRDFVPQEYALHRVRVVGVLKQLIRRY